MWDTVQSGDVALACDDSDLSQCLTSLWKVWTLWIIFISGNIGKVFKTVCDDCDVNQGGTSAGIWNCSNHCKIVPIIAKPTNLQVGVKDVAYCRCSQRQRQNSKSGRTGHRDSTSTGRLRHSSDTDQISVDCRSRYIGGFWYIGTSWALVNAPCTSVPIPPLLLFQLSQKSLVVHWYIGTSGTLGTSGALVHAPCTSVPIPPLLIFQLSQKIATSFTPTWRIYYMLFFRIN